MVVRIRYPRFIHRSRVLFGEEVSAFLLIECQAAPNSSHTMPVARITMSLFGEGRGGCD